MEPTFADGAFVLVDPRAYEVRLPVVGDIVTCRHPFRGDLAMIKRVAAVDPQGRLTLLGDNASASTDSRTLGPVAADAVFGRVTALLA
jgi:nickel-type superoxide dismutase maturation protease